MSAHITLSCDGHRHGQPCRGALHTRELTAIAARLGEGAAWRSILVRDGADVTFLELCPSRGHDEEPA